MRTIVIAVDLSPQATATVAALTTLNLAQDPTIILTYILPTSSEDDSPADIPNPDNTPEKRLIQAESKLLELSQQIGEHLDPELDLAIEIEITSGNPAEEIVRFAGIYQADLIILGSRNLTGLNRILMGSVSTEVLESASCSVYIVKE